MNHAFKFIFFILLFYNPAKSIALDSYDPTSDFLLTFGDRCPMSYGNLNRGAIADSKAIQSIIDSISKDPACNGVTGALGSVAATLNQGTLLAPKEDELIAEQTQQACLSTQKAFNEVASALTNVNDPNYSYAQQLQQQVQTCETQIVSTQGNTSSATLALRYQTAQNLQTYTIQLFQQLNASQKCVTSNPSILAQIGGQVMGLSSSLVGTTAGATLLSASVLVDQLIAFVKNYKLGHSIKKLTQATQLTGLDCAVEAISDSYCKSKDTEASILADKTISKESSSCILTQSSLIGNNIGILNNLINSLSNSGGNSLTAIDHQVEINKDRSSIQNIRTMLKQIPLDAQQKTAEEMPEYTKYAINWMAREISNGNISALSTIIPPSYSGSGNSDGTGNIMVYLYSQGAASEIPPGRLTNGLSVSDYLKQTYPNPPTIAQTTKVVNDLMDRLEALENSKSALIGKDSNKLVSDMVSSRPISAAQYLEKTKNYLENLIKEYQTDLNDPKISKEDTLFYNTQMKRIMTIKTPIEKSLDTLYSSDASETNDKKTSEILSDLAPHSDPQYLSVTLQDVIGMDLQKRIQLNKLDANIEDLVKYSASKSMTDLTGALAQLGPTLAVSKSQLDDSKRISTTNLQTISDIFEKQINGVLSDLKKKISENIDPNTNRDNIAKTCILMAQIPMPAKMPSCAGSKWTDPESGEVLSFDDIIKKPYESRVCTIHQFNQKALFLKQTRGAH